MAFPEVDERFLRLGVRAITRIVGDGDGLIVFGAGAEVVAHENRRVSEAVARGNVRGINLQGGGIGVEGALVVAGQTPDFPERVWGGRGIWQAFRVTLERGDGLCGVGGAGLDVSIA